jgi:endonuclease/exonuclease/phosphatase family metal-dependent hydrolase
MQNDHLLTRDGIEVGDRRDACPAAALLLAMLFAGSAAGVESLSVLTYNTHGNQVADWSTNSPQVQAIGRQMSYLQPDVITFQEIPFTNTWQMPNFVRAFLPGYQLATNSGTDGYIRSVILSRFPIIRSTKWLDGVSLTNFGYDGSFTRDLFEAEIAVPDYNANLHVFTTHLKSGSATADKQRRAAEASAISNFLTTVFLPAAPGHPYLLTGDMNEHYTTNAILRLTNAPTGLRLTTPVNPFTGTRFTFSIRGSLVSRYDYILPSGLLWSNVTSSQVFRTDLLTNPPPPLLTADAVTASDHLPVVMTFANPFNTPFHLLSLTASNQQITLRWETAAGRRYRVEASSNLTAWFSLTTNLTATSPVSTFTTNAGGSGVKFFRIYREP